LPTRDFPGRDPPSRPRGRDHFGDGSAGNECRSLASSALPCPSRVWHAWHDHAMRAMALVGTLGMILPCVPLPFLEPPDAVTSLGTAARSGEQEEHRASQKHEPRRKSRCHQARVQLEARAGLAVRSPAMLATKPVLAWRSEAGVWHTWHDHAMGDPRLGYPLELTWNRGSGTKIPCQAWQGSLPYVPLPLVLVRSRCLHRDPDAVTILGTAAPGMSAGRLPLFRIMPALFVARPKGPLPAWKQASARTRCCSG
jgi:hypothetical protein